MSRKGNVYYREIFAGLIFEDEDGYVFQYDSKYLANENNPQISFTIPKQKEPFHSKVLFPFFDGLIPEGWLLTITQNVWKIEKKDRFGILLSVCRDCIGAVSVIGEMK
ncbi:MAG: HipA N-terminal domain-containing protein [Leptospiraceae bacterium]|nr:HipA N-terminal domain-containing protein [Leptospiraceae bacterium]